MKTEPSWYAALLNRIAPHLGLPREICVCPSVSGHAAREGGLQARVVEEAHQAFLSDEGSISPELTADVNEHLAMHGLAVLQNVWTTREDGSRRDARPEIWPLDAVEWSEVDSTLWALTTSGREPIVHGDGRWVVVRLHDLEPWTWGAIMPGANLFADRAFAVRDRARNAESHGDSKWIGTMPERVGTKDAEGVAFRKELVELYKARRVMLKPFGSEVERSEAMSQNWQIFREIITSDNGDIARVLLGQEMRGSDSSQRLTLAQLYGVRNDIVEADLRGMARAFNTGTIRPWQAVNFGRVDLISGMRWLIPDADEDARRTSMATRMDAFNRHVKDLRDNGFDVTQAFVDDLSRQYGVTTPLLVVRTPPTAPLSNGVPSPLQPAPNGLAS